MAAKRKPKRRKNRKVGQFRQQVKTAAVFAHRIGGKAWPVVLLIVLVFAARHWLFTTPRFALNQILVNKCEHVNSKKLISFIDARIGTNLFTIDLKALQKRIVDHDWIKSVCVSRRLPDKLVITITEHEPYALINLVKLYYVNDEGFLFAKVEKGDSRDYPVLSGFSSADFHDSADSSERNLALLRTAVRLIKVAERDGSLDRGRISEVRYDPLIGYSLVLQPRRTEVRLGKDQFERKLARLKAIRKRLGNRAAQLKLVDLVNPDQAVIKGFGKVDAG